MIGCFSKKKFGSLESWGFLMDRFLEMFDHVIGRGMNRVMMYRHLIVLFHNCLRVGMEDEKLSKNLEFCLPYITELVK